MHNLFIHLFILLLSFIILCSGAIGPRTDPSLGDEWVGPMPEWLWVTRDFGAKGNCFSLISSSPLFFTPSLQFLNRGQQLQKNDGLYLDPFLPIPSSSFLRFFPILTLLQVTEYQMIPKPFNELLPMQPTTRLFIFRLALIESRIC